MLANTFRVLLGMRLEADRLVLRPMVPPSLGGTRTASNVPYRHVMLTIVVHGYGDDVSSTVLDGKPLTRAEIPATLTGPHRVEITMNGRWPSSPTVHIVPNRFAPRTPHAELVGNALRWQPIANATQYALYGNGAPLRRTTSTSTPVQTLGSLVEYQVLAIDAAGDQSFLSEPVRLESVTSQSIVKPGGPALERADSGYSGSGYLRLTTRQNVLVQLPIRVARDGVYAVDVRYANGSGPINTEDKVAVRTLVVDGDTTGVFVLPQRGANRWSDWGWSNVLRARLRAGAHTLTLAFTPLDENMNRHVNTALLDQLRLTLLGDAPDR
jgi:hypothetical protein